MVGKLFHRNTQYAKPHPLQDIKPAAYQKLCHPYHQYHISLHKCSHTHKYTHTHTFIHYRMYKSPRTKAMKVYINRKPKSCKCDDLTWFNASFYRVTLLRFIFIHFFHIHNHQIHNFLSSSLSLDLYHHHVNMPYTNNCLWCNFGYWCMNEYWIESCLFIYFNYTFHLF